MTMLSVVIPVYNDEGNIAQIMQRVLAIRHSLQTIHINDMELLVVNDGSQDRTIEVARLVSRLDPCIRVISHPEHRGYGAALKTGFENARGELIGFLDADGTYPPEYFPELCMAVFSGSDLVIGSRVMGSQGMMPFVKRISNYLFAHLLMLIAKVRVTDIASEMRVFHRDVYKKVCPLPDGMNLTSAMSTRAIHDHLIITEVPIPYNRRTGRSKLNIGKEFNFVLQSILWLAMYYSPVRVLTTMGLIGIFLSLLVALGLVVALLNGTTHLGTWGTAALFTVLASGVIGTSAYSLGIMFNHLVSFFHKMPIRHRLFVNYLFKTSKEFSFGLMGGLLLGIGAILAVMAVSLGISGWNMNRLWSYLMGSALFVIMGAQLLMGWILAKAMFTLNLWDETTHQPTSIQC